MKIVADENIPLLQHYFGACGELVAKPGRAINQRDLQHADILLVRSVTQVNRELLQDTTVKFVASATTGMDHLDTQWLDQAGIRWAVAKGCNSTAVVEYVISVIAALQADGMLRHDNLRAGVIGVGHIGSQVVAVLKMLGFDVVQYDPVRALSDASFSSASLEDLAELDFISLHTPLTYQGAYPTFHLLEKQFLQRQKTGCVLLNSGRGAAINFADLKQYGAHLHWCLDVWENEPEIDLAVLKKALIATPHIAGYTVQGKYRGTQMIYEAACQQQVISESKLALVELPGQTISFANARVDWRDVVLKIYDPRRTTQHMREALLGQQDTFDGLRKNFIERQEFANVKVQDVVLNEFDGQVLDYRACLHL